MSVAMGCWQRRGQRAHRKRSVEGLDAAGAVLGNASCQLVLQALRGVVADPELQVLDCRQVATHWRQRRMRDRRGRCDAGRRACDGYQPSCILWLLAWRCVFART